MNFCTNVTSHGKAAIQNGYGGNFFTQLMS